MSNDKTRQLVAMGMLAALAYVVMVFIRIPVFPAAPYLTIDLKDVIITIAGFIYGPLAAFLISLVVSLVEMVTVSTTGWIGAVMNLISSCAFACTASLVYKARHDLKGAVIGLVSGTLVMTVVMLLWNYFLTPIYTGMPREVVAGMLPTVFLPFNLLKGGINAAIAMLLYKPVVSILRRARFAPPSAASGSRRGLSAGVIIGASAVLAVCIVLVVLILTGVIS